ncbi:MAG: hypothetical protein GX102_12295 [Porphyromonadaceae bacterium]|nr:hypothetical protein [Porphyromonadaceae bacterium]
MNKIISFILLFFELSFLHVSAQEKGTLGFTFSALNSNMLMQSSSLNPDYTAIKGRGFMSFSADYWYPVSDWIEFETGVNYSLQSFAETNNNPASEQQEPKYYDENYINIPVGLRLSFLKYGFVNTGILLDVWEEQGIGAYFGAGVKIESPIGFGIFANPYLKTHSILPIDFNEKAKRLVDAGVRVGVSFKIGRNTDNWRR